MKREIAISLITTATVSIAVITFLFFQTGNDYYKISEGASLEQIEAFKKNNIDFLIKEDGSVWVNRLDEMDVVQCCT
ncbi:hypothetical protein E8L90_09250 [Brevibacillus antibioticus]|uniref:DUF3139 domain-containing protein n=1 Tax=Brevibacillus antibioticus TaxID=2570228 RepID=A0A4U2Y655_9BACL|nr:hypothetical protein [Brevibacillus antibioticus]TKI55615.1 hypothetical protein E8L90_09250 [Brevibacillus antibioticus]